MYGYIIHTETLCLKVDLCRGVFLYTLLLMSEKQFNWLLVNIIINNNNAFNLYSAFQGTQTLYIRYLKHPKSYTTKLQSQIK